MNIELFIQTRKELGYSQSQLCDGICTQATLSKFENSEQIPAIRILLKLCTRLGLTLDDIFPIQLQSQTEQTKILDQAEFTLITSEYAQAEKSLTQVQPELLNTNSQLQYYFVKGFLSALTDANVVDTLYYFDQIINNLDEQHRTIFTQLAYTGIGVTYSRSGSVEKAEFYFQKVFSGLYELLLIDDKSIWRALNMIFYTAEYFAHVSDYKISDSLLEYGYNVCAKNHVTYYVARILFRQAQNAKATKQPTEVIDELLNDAQAFAKINKNDVLLTRIESMRREAY
ncbi:helix-turn-helix transcriptional regulator [Paucilactobacillus nenjiangensis]|uniref:Helix-turn-helix transcriptional regulator n=1 Tax=Paucilactobacillus nenjiangensis TaxID=1296540 RepID=A0A5P1X0N1_9LACO|nr:helix-turn-helix transcriptional regulator [Paucilactobacillus nenjiangensis]QER66434.1 helix-turn-helix transcriptional regulator [Paucilactobacillus nenjiangensis]